MPKFKVTVAFTQSKEKELTIFAKDEDEAMQKAEERVGEWEGVEECEATECERE